MAVDALADISAVDLFKAVAPDLDPSDDTILELYLDLAGQSVSATVFKSVYKQAVVYLAAHLLAMDGRASGGAGATGPIIAERAGEVSLNYGFSGNSSGAAAGLESTVFGRRFLALRRSRAGVKPLSTQQYYTWPTESES